MSVSDVADDVRRAAVLSLGFVMCNDPEQLPPLVKLLAESYNPHVRYILFVCWGKLLYFLCILCVFSWFLCDSVSVGVSLPEGKASDTRLGSTDVQWDLFGVANGTFWRKVDRVPREERG